MFRASTVKSNDAGAVNTALLVGFVILQMGGMLT